MLNVDPFRAYEVCFAFPLTESKIEAKTSAAKLKVRVGKDVTLWCNATGYPKPVVYWTREDRNRRLPDGSYQFWVGLDVFWHRHVLNRH